MSPDLMEKAPEEGQEAWEALLRPEEGGEGETRRPAGALLALVGLGAIWGGLFLVAKAQEISRTEVSIGLERPRAGWRQEQAVAGLDAREKVSLPCDVRFRQTSARQIVRLLLARAGIDADEEDLRRIREEPRSLQRSGVPLLDLIHEIVDDPKVGLAVRRQNADFFAHELSATEPAQGPLSQFDWRARVALSTEPTLVFPSARTKVWGRFALRPAAPGVDPSQTRIAVEIWRGDERLASGEGILGPGRPAQLNFTADGFILASAERAPTAGAETSTAAGGRLQPFDLHIFYRETPPAAGETAAGPAP